MEEKIITNQVTGFMKSSNEGKLDVSGMGLGDIFEDWYNKVICKDEEGFEPWDWGLLDYDDMDSEHHDSLKLFHLLDVLYDNSKDARYKVPFDDLENGNIMDIELRLKGHSERYKYYTNMFSTQDVFTIVTSVSLRLLQAQASGKYPPMNFMSITEEDRDRIYDSAKRHLYQYLVLDDKTEDHLGAFYANCMFLWILNNKETANTVYNKFYKNGQKNI